MNSSASNAPVLTLRPTPAWGRMSTLWLLLVPVCAAIYTLLLTIAPNDFWYNVRAGAHIAQSGDIPTVALWTSSVADGTPYFYQSWIAQWLLFQTLERFGLSGVMLVRTLCLTLAFALIQWAAWRRIKRLAPIAPDTALARLAAGSTLLAFALAASNMDVRPQTFSVPLFCLFSFIIFEWPFLNARLRAIAVAATSGLMLLWVNTHGAFFTALVLVGAFACGEVLHSRFLHSQISRSQISRSQISRSQISHSRHNRKVERLFGAPMPDMVLRAGVILAALCTLVTLFNPRGIGIYSYVWLLARLEAGQKFIQEWQAPSFSQWYGTLFFFALFLTAVLIGVLWSRSRKTEESPQRDYSGDAPLGVFGVRFSELLIFFLLAIMALRDIRSIIWFALFAVPILAALSTRCFAIGTGTSDLEIVPRAAQVVNAIIALLLISSIFAFLPRNKTGLPLPPEYVRHFAPTPQNPFPIGFQNEPPLLLDRDTPVEAVAFLKKNPPRGKLWNDFVYGSYLVWATMNAPRLAPHADPRVEMRPLAFWEEYGRIAAGDKDSARVLESQNFTDALLNGKEQPRLRRVLKAAGWRETFRGGGAIVMRREK